VVGGRRSDANVSAAGALIPAELQLIHELRQVGLAPASATLAIVMLVRRHMRPRAELLDLVASYPSLESAAARQDALADLQHRGWIDEYQSLEHGPMIVMAAPTLEQDLRSLVPTASAAIETAMASRRSVKVLGHMGDPRVYETFRGRLAQARSSIDLPMVMTTPQISTIDTLAERARAGVRVRLLLATPRLAASIRGQGEFEQATQRLAGWRAHARSHPNLQLRVTSRVADMRASSSMLVDGSVLRFDVYDPASERSTQGTMIEIVSAEQTNIASLFGDYFDDAWHRARPLGAWRLGGWWLQRSWVVAVVIAIAAFATAVWTSHPAFATLLAGGVVGYLFNQVDALRNWISRRRNGGEP